MANKKKKDVIELLRKYGLSVQTYLQNCRSFGIKQANLLTEHFLFHNRPDVWQVEGL